MVVEQLLNAMLLAGMYSLVAVGFTLFFGVLDLVNFAHGEMATLAVFVSLALLVLTAWGSGEAIWGGVLAAIVLVGCAGVLVERLALRRLRVAPPLLMLLATVGVSIVLREAVRLLYPAGSNPQVFPSLFPGGSVALGGLRVPYDAVTILVVAWLLIAMCDRFINRTRMGACIRAVAQDREAALFMGVDLDRTVAVTFFVGSALGAVAGILNGAFYGIVRYDMGLLMAIKGFSAAVVGGLGSFYGALVGSLVLAGVETASAAYLPGGSQLRDVLSFLLVIAFLVLRPTGLLGERSVEKV
ncbi:MAG: branched-chain amino acid ABC transporter permease [Armatimonadota bacterium]|nr:branched-chain amino acid ABC transporter permease [Armatimonadota bacterium]MDR5696402.1 branched-chain amino acid ABC transporter permease [Armatimonadota bacterium]